MVTTLQRSPYVKLGNREFRSPRGVRVVPVFSTTMARMLLIPTKMAHVLQRDRIDEGELTPAQRRELLRYELVTTSPSTVRAEHYSRMGTRVSSLANRTFILLPTAYCNMGCSYCGQLHLKRSLSDEHRSAVVSRVRTAISHPETNHVDIGWFGGEPLMAFRTIQSMSKPMIDAADAHGVRYSSSIVTNGALLDERKLRTLYHDCRVNTFTITIDGQAEAHDAHRPLKSGRPSFERLVSLLGSTLDDAEYGDLHLVIRTNVDIRNCDYIDPYLEEMAGRGFANRLNVTFSLMPIHSWGNDVSRVKLAHAEFATRELRWFEKMAELGLNCQLLPDVPKLKTCQAVTRSAEVIGPNGSVFSCTEHPLVPQHEKSSVLIPLSDLRPQQLRPAGAFDSWVPSVSRGEMPCSTCWLLPVCGGSCPKKWAEDEVPCPSLKSNLVERMNIACRSKGLTELGPLETSGGADEET